MSYEKVKTFSISGGKLKMTYSPNNISPQAWYTNELVLDEMQAHSIITGIIDGTLQPYRKEGRFFDFCNILRDKFAELNKYSSWEKDRKYQTNRYQLFRNDFVKSVGLPLMAKAFGELPFEVGEYDLVGPSIDEMNTRDLYKKLEEEFIASGKVFIKAAVMSDIFIGYDVLLADDGLTVYLAKRERYNNKGVLDNSDGQATRFVCENEEDSYNVWDFLERGAELKAKVTIG